MAFIGHHHLTFKKKKKFSGRADAGFGRGQAPKNSGHGHEPTAAVAGNVSSHFIAASLEPALSTNFPLLKALLEPKMSFVTRGQVLSQALEGQITFEKKSCWSGPRPASHGRCFQRLVACYSGRADASFGAVADW